MSQGVEERDTWQLTVQWRDATPEELEPGFEIVEP
jgi:hypothetical protein